uniref:Fibrous sheath-interacting protein 1 n=1 Tax=Xenopus tropicalis TaxID=8364 RepID=A0A6I8Q0Y9_XENTR
MDITKGSLDMIARPASSSRSRPGSRVSTSLSTERLKRSSTSLSLEVLTPEPGFSEMQCLGLDTHETQLEARRKTPIRHQERLPEQKHLPKNSTESYEECIRDEMDFEPPFPTKETDHLFDEAEDDFLDFPSAEFEDTGENDDEVPNDEHDFVNDKATDPKLERAIKRMQALDNILQRKLAKEKEVKAQGLEIHIKLWEELQRATTQSSARSHEESINTSKFLALTPQLDETEDTVNMQMGKIFSPVFPTQLPNEDPAEDDDHETLKVCCVFFVDDMSGDSSHRSDCRTRQSKGQMKGVDFIQRNIELAKDAGSYILLMDDEKLRLEQLLEDIQEDCSDEDITGDMSSWIVPGEGYTPEPDEYDQLAEIEARLQRVRGNEESLETSLSDPKIPKEIFQEVLLEKNGNSHSAPGELVLRYTKELREQKMRLREIDQQLQDMGRNSITPTSLLSHCSLSTDSPVYA